MFEFDATGTAAEVEASLREQYAAHREARSQEDTAANHAEDERFDAALAAAKGLMASGTVVASDGPYDVGITGEGGYVNAYVGEGVPDEAVEEILAELAAADAPATASGAVTLQVVDTLDERDDETLAGIVEREGVTIDGLVDRESMIAAIRAHRLRVGPDIV